MSPSEYVQQYRKLSVFLEDICVPVDVHAYMINQPGPHSTAKALGMWDRIEREMDDQARQSLPMHSGQLAHGAMSEGPSPRPRGYQVPADRHEDPDPLTELHHVEKRLKLVPYGKGSPQAIAEYLALAVKAEVTTAAGLQKFADDRYVGLDCSGFVSNYLVAIGKMKAGEVGNRNSQSYAQGHDKRLTMESLKNLDIMVWADGHHMAIMEDPSTGKQGATATVTESNGPRGLDSETYTFVSVDKNGLFKVNREKGGEHHVHIFNWKLA